MLHLMQETYIKSMHIRRTNASFNACYRPQEQLSGLRLYHDQIDIQQRPGHSLIPEDATNRPDSDR